ncbi:MAG: hypothetical protein AAF318_06745 [Pseudomonadota bacterium]
MTRQHFPCLIHGPDAGGWYSVVVPGPNVNAQGRTEGEALIAAADSLQELIDEGFDEHPGDLEAAREPGDRPGIIQVSRLPLPAQ